jgi:hypothetical protein
VHTRIDGRALDMLARSFDSARVELVEGKEILKCRVLRVNASLQEKCGHAIQDSTRSVALSYRGGAVCHDLPPLLSELSNITTSVLSTAWTEAWKMKPVIKTTRIVNIGPSLYLLYRKLPKTAKLSGTCDEVFVLPLCPGKSSNNAFTISGRTLANWSLKPLLKTFPSLINMTSRQRHVGSQRQDSFISQFSLGLFQHREIRYLTDGNLVVHLAIPLGFFDYNTESVFGNGSVVVVGIRN